MTVALAAAHLAAVADLVDRFATAIEALRDARAERAELTVTRPLAWGIYQLADRARPLTTHDHRSRELLTQLVGQADTLLAARFGGARRTAEETEARLFVLASLARG